MRRFWKNAVLSVLTLGKGQLKAPRKILAPAIAPISAVGTGSSGISSIRPGNFAANLLNPPESWLVIDIMMMMDDDVTCLIGDMTFLSNPLF